MREAHPGELMPAHRSLEEKLALAGRLRDEAPIRRPILVDDLDGTVHRAYGTLPNMTWVLGRGGVILYKAMWTSAARVEEFMGRASVLSSGPPVGTAPFYTEQAEMRRRDMDQFYKLLERNGPRSVAEFARAEQVWSERAKTMAERLRAERRGG